MNNFLFALMGIVKALFVALSHFIRDTPPHLLGIYLVLGLILFIVLFVRGNHK